MKKHKEIFLDDFRSIAADGVQWICRTYVEVPQEDGESKKRVSAKHYFGSLKSAAKHLANEVLMRMWNDEVFSAELELELIGVSNE